jgi:hypothetical protein
MKINKAEENMLPKRLDFALTKRHIKGEIERERERIFRRKNKRPEKLYTMIQVSRQQSATMTTTTTYKHKSDGVSDRGERERERERSTLRRAKRRKKSIKMNNPNLEILHMFNILIISR